jgi:hypothetical protein
MSHPEYQAAKTLLPKKGKSIVQAYTTTTAIDIASSALGTEGLRTILRLVSTTDCHIVCGASTDTATTSDYLVKAGIPIEGFMPLNATHLHVVQSSAGGNLHISIASP